MTSITLAPMSLRPPNDLNCQKFGRKNHQNYPIPLIERRFMCHWLRFDEVDRSKNYLKIARGLLTFRLKFSTSAQWLSDDVASRKCHINLWISVQESNIMRYYPIFNVCTHLSVSFVFSEVAVELAPVPPREDDVRRAAQHFEHLPREAGGEGVAEQLVGLFEW